MENQAIEPSVERSADLSGFDANMENQASELSADLSGFDEKLSTILKHFFQEKHIPIDAQQMLLHELRRSYTFSAAGFSAYLCHDLASARDRFGQFLIYFDEHPQGNIWDLLYLVSFTTGRYRKEQDELVRYFKYMQTERSILFAENEMIGLQYDLSSGKPLDVAGAGCRFTMDWSQRLNLIVVDDNQRGRSRAKLIGLDAESRETLFDDNNDAVRASLLSLIEPGMISLAR